MPFVKTLRPFAALRTQRIRSLFLIAYLFLQIPVAAQTPISVRGSLDDLVRLTVSARRAVIVALRPGEEDHALAAHFRWKMGTRTVFVYLTNGESLPSALDDRNETDLAARRKEEAWQAARFLEGDAFFLNLPDPGILQEGDSLARWKEAATAALAKAFRALRPHLAVVSLPGSSVYGALATTTPALVRSAVTIAAQDTLMEESIVDGILVRPWSVQQVWQTSARKRTGAQLLTDRPLPEIRISAFEAARRARSNFRSFSPEEGPSPGVIPLVAYTEVPVRGKTGVSSPGAGIRIVSKAFEPLRKRIAALAVLRSSEDRLTLVVHVLDTLDSTLRTRASSMEVLDRFTLSQWKADLERLRVLLLNVKIDVSVSDSILAPRQLMFVQVRNLDSAFSGEETRIQFSPFPATGWLVDLKSAMNIPVRAPQEIRLMTPEKLPLNFPVNGPGLHANRLAYPLNFTVYHIGKTRLTTYIAQREALLRYSPVRNFELSTPDVVYGAPEEIRVRAFSASRDPGRGSLLVSGPSCEDDTLTFGTEGKDEWGEASVNIRWRGTPASDLDTILLSHPKATIAQVRVHRLRTSVDTAIRVGFVPRIRGSALEKAVRRVAPAAQVIDADRLATECGSTDVLVLDRGAFGNRTPDSTTIDALTAWIRTGGQLVVFPQSEEFEFVGIGFDASRGIGADEPIMLKTGSGRLARMVDPGEPDTWRNWKFARAWSVLRGSGLSKADLTVTDRSSKLTVAAEVPLGAGRIRFVGLNIEQQAQAFHLGALGLLANTIMR